MSDKHEPCFVIIRIDRDTYDKRIDHDLYDKDNTTNVIQVVWSQERAETIVKQLNEHPDTNKHNFYFDWQQTIAEI